MFVCLCVCLFVCLFVLFCLFVCLFGESAIFSSFAAPYTHSRYQVLLLFLLFSSSASSSADITTLCGV
jgi:hypothetical protein